MSCEEIMQMDGVPPRCAPGGPGCILPPLAPEAAEALRLRSMIIRLSGLVDAGAALSIMKADGASLMLLAKAEDALREMDDDTD